MDIEVKRQPERTELRVEILAPEGDCPQLQRLLAFLAAEDPAIPAQREGERRRLTPEDILRLYGEDKAVFSEYLKALRAVVRADSEEKLCAAGMEIPATV